MTIAGEARAAAAFLEGSPVPVLSTSVDPGDRQFSANSQRMRSLVEERGWPSRASAVRGVGLVGSTVATGVSGAQCAHSAGLF